MEQKGLQNQVQSCRYFLEKKKRHCRLEKVKGKDFCVQHIHLSSGEETTRVPCPLDGTHTCDKTNLEKHLKNCNARKIIPKEPWYVPDINSEKRSAEYDCVGSLKEASSIECADVVTRLKEISVPRTEKYSILHSALQDDLKEFEGSEAAMKKLVQNSSLLGVMDEKKILVSPGNYVEFGAGRGQLTTSILKSVSETSGFILVDRGTNRRKLDAKYRQMGQTKIIRIRADIKDLCLRHIELLKIPKAPPLVGVSKHLCGSATDLTLRCIVDTAPEPGFHGGIIALCCHHRCEWAEYCGKEYFEKNNFSPRDFSILSLMSSWAVCCFRTKDPELEENIKNGEMHNKLGFISDAEKDKVGLLCKSIIDNGRLHFLQKNGFDAQLVEYTTKSVTLENVALIFSKRKNEDTKS